jgi:hypothetical protein
MICPFSKLESRYDINLNTLTNEGTMAIRWKACAQSVITKFVVNGKTLPGQQEENTEKEKISNILLEVK